MSPVQPGTGVRVAMIVRSIVWREVSIYSIRNTG